MLPLATELPPGLREATERTFVETYQQIFTTAHQDIWMQVFHSRGVVLGVLILLIALSIISIFIVAYKWIYLARAQRDSGRFLDLFWQSKRLDAVYQMADETKRSPLAQVFKAGYVELTKVKQRSQGEKESLGLLAGGGIENVDRAMRRASSTQITSLERLVPFLATIGSTAPFIGLFGTVWGIMLAFHELRAENRALLLESVGPHISEALIATAFGLFAAIPAVMAYNYFTTRVRVLAAEMDNFSSDFLNILKRHFFT